MIKPPHDKSPNKANQRDTPAKKASLTELEAALARLFDSPSGRNASWITLPGGSQLFSEGETADHLYLVQTGRLGVFVENDQAPGQRLIGIIRPGEPAGEMSLVAGTPHTATVTALRDTQILAMPREDFLKAAMEAPEALLILTRKMIERARNRGVDHAVPAVYAFVSTLPATIRPLLDHIAAAVSDLGYKVTIIDSTWLGESAERYSQAEDDHDFVLYLCEYEELSWSMLAARQADHMFIVTDTQSPPKLPENYASLTRTSPPDLILIQTHNDIQNGLISGTKAYLDAFAPARWFHIARGRNVYAQRLARIMTGHSVGLVCSGGGARAYAHIGAIQALREAHVPIDFVCGASMGAIIAANVGLGWNDGEIEAHIRQAFVDSSPLDDIALPFIAMTSGHKVDERLKTHFKDIQIEDMPLPFFSIASNLTTGRLKTHRTGPLHKALRASISLPGVLPPVIEDGHVLVDGAVMHSFPADMMRAYHLGSVVGIDVTRAMGLDPKSIERPKNLPGWFTSGQWRQGPPIVSILMRSATITSSHDLAESRKATDLLIIPEPDGVEIRDWHAYDEAVECGYDTAVQALREITVSVTHLRRFNLSYHPDIPAFTPDEGVTETRSVSSKKTLSKAAKP